MEKQINRLGDAELEIMLVLWDADQPMTSGQILERLRGRRNWALSTLMTALARLGEKGFVLCDRSTRTNYYAPRISAREYKARESRSFLERLHGNSVQNLVASLYDGKAISSEDLTALRQMLDEMEKGLKSDGK